MQCQYGQCWEWVSKKMFGQTGRGYLIAQKWTKPDWMKILTILLLAWLQRPGPDIELWFHIAIYPAAGALYTGIVYLDHTGPLLIWSAGGRRRSSAGLTLARRRRRRANVEPSLGNQCLLGWHLLYNVQADHYMLRFHSYLHLETCLDALILRNNGIQENGIKVFWIFWLPSCPFIESNHFKL